MRYSLLLFAFLTACGARTDLGRPEESETPIAEPNECGGTAMLPGVVDGACGICGLYACESPDALFCDDEETNRCGECGPVPEEICNERDDDCDEVVDEGCVIRARSGEGHETRVRIDGEWMIVDVTLRGRAGDVFAIQTETGDEIQLNDPEERARFASIDGRLVSWNATGSSVSNVRAYDLETGDRFEPPEPLAQVGNSSVHEGVVVFSAEVAGRGDADVFLWEPRSGRVDQVGDPDQSEMNADLFGDWLVLEVAPPSDTIFGRQVEAWNLATAERIRLSDGLPDGWHVGPTIHGTRVVWHREHGSSAPSRTADLYLFDLETGERRVLEEGGGALFGRIEGDLVCWSGTGQLNGSGGSWTEGGTRLLNLATGRRQVMNAAGHDCDISGRRVAWLLRRRSLDPYYYDLLEGEPE